MADAITDNRTLVTNANAVAAFDDLTGAASGTLDTEIFIQPTGSIGQYITNSLGGLLYDAGSAQNWANNTFYIWINCGIVGLLDTKANGGMRIRFCGATVTDWFEVYVAGSDDWPASVQGGWTQFVVDIETARSTAVTNGWTNGTVPATSAIRYVGYAAVTGGTMPRMVDNTWLDEIRRLPANRAGIIVDGQNGGTTPWTSDDIFAQLGVAVGTFVPAPGGAWKLNTPIQIGDGTGTGGNEVTEFEAINETWLWENNEFVPDGFYKIDTTSPLLGSTTVTLGVKTGTGDDATGAQGLRVSSASDGPRWDLSFVSSAFTTVNLYGCSFQHGGQLTCQDESISTLYIDCVKVSAGNSGTHLKDSFIAPASGDGFGVLNTRDLDNIRFCTFEFLDGHAIQYDLLGTSPQTDANVGNQFTGFSTVQGSTDAAIYLASTSQDLIINNTDSNLVSTSWRANAGSTVTINNVVNVTITVQDNAGNPIEGAAVFLEESGTGTDVIPFDTTNASGQVTAAYSGTLPVDVVGFVRKGTAVPVYKAAAINDRITSSGLNATITLIEDS